LLARCWWLIPVILDSCEAEIRTAVLGRSGQIVPETPFPKITRVKWTGGVAQAIECLLCKGKALSSNPSPIKTDKQKEMNFTYKDKYRHRAKR
jgi:hypothetical protein